MLESPHPGAASAAPDLPGKRGGEYSAFVEAPKNDQLVVQCECGFEVRGSADEIVPALQKHAGESHNMKVTREQVLARAHPI
jgi:predicted small metal-binding protein